MLFAVAMSGAYADGGGAGGGGGIAAAPTRDASYQAGVAAIERQDWQAAIKAFERSLAWDRFNADAHNWLGFAYRNAGDLKLAFKHYDEALRLDPQNKGAHEYLGEAYLITKEIDRAEQHLAALERICGRACPEYHDLDEAIQKAKSGS